MPATSPTLVVRRRQIGTGVITAVSVVGAILGVTLLSTIDNADGTPWLESNVIGQSLTTLGVVIAAVLPSTLRASKDAAVARDQLENSHVDNPEKVTNVRENIDANHDNIVEILRKFEEKVERKLEATASDVRGIRRDIGRLWDKAEGHSGRIQSLEDIERTDPGQGR